MPWKRLAIEVPGPRVGLVEAVLETRGALSVTCLDAADEPILEPPPAATPLWSGVCVEALFAAEAELTEIRSALREVLGAEPAGWREDTVEDRDWHRAWLADARPMCFGERLWVLPCDMPPPQPDAINLRLDPGLAFGTGIHPTTALCLEWLATYPPQGRRVIDYGCGSGILALAALRLGAAAVVAVDNDPQALTATRENARRNAVSAGLTVRSAAEADPAPGDLVIANILSGVLVALGERLLRLLRPGGHLVLSGVLADQVDVVTAAFAHAIDFQPPTERDGWIRLVGSRRI